MTDQTFDSVWDAIGTSPSDSASLKARSAAMATLQDVVRGWGVTQVEAAARLRLTQPRLNDLLRGRIQKFSLDALVDLAERAGCPAGIHFDRPAA